MLEGQPAVLVYLIQSAEYQLPMPAAAAAADVGPAPHIMAVLEVPAAAVLVDSQLILPEQLQDNQELTVLVAVVVVAQPVPAADRCLVETAAMESYL
jgi:hypothetical protein